jgi:Phosphotransferase enzyme family
MQQSGAMLSPAEQALGRSLRFEGRTARGESASTFVVTSGESTFVLKVREAGPGVLDNQHRLARLIESLRSRGFPAPAVRGVGEAAGLVFVLQEFVGGEPLEPAPGHPPAPRTLHAVLPSLLESILLQRDGGDPSVPPWPGWLLETLEHGGDGYCLHETMRQRTETSRLLDSLQSQLTAVRGIPVRTTDIVHFDLNPANVLHQHGRLTGSLTGTCRSPARCRAIEDSTSRRFSSTTTTSTRRSGSSCGSGASAIRRRLDRRLPLPPNPASAGVVDPSSPRQPRGRALPANRDGRARGDPAQARRSLVHTREVTSMRKLSGKYRGLVESNADPESLGRLQVTSPDVFRDESPRKCKSSS